MCPFILEYHPLHGIPKKSIPVQGADQAPKMFVFLVTLGPGLLHFGFMSYKKADGIIWSPRTGPIIVFFSRHGIVS